MPVTATRIAIAFTILDRDTTQTNYGGVWYSQQCNDDTCRAEVFASIARGSYGFLEARNMIVDVDYLAIWDR